MARRTLKRDRDIESYIHAGAVFRILKEVYAKALVEVGNLCPVKVGDSMKKGYYKLGGICSDVEENMFFDYPGISDDYLCVYYGSLLARRDNQVDKHVRELMKRILMDMLKELEEENE